MDAYLVLAEDLVIWELDDLAKGLDVLGLAPRAEGKTAFPDAGDMIAAVRTVKVARLEAERQRQRETAEEAAKARCKREREEEAAAGGRVKSEAELRLEAVLKKANEPRKPSVGVHVAPVQMTAAEIMERVSRERGEREAGAR